MPSSFPRRFVVEVTVTEVTRPDGGDSKTTPEPPMSGKNKVREASMSVGDVPSQQSQQARGDDDSGTARDRFKESVDGFSAGVLGSPRLYQRPEAADRIVPRDVREQVRRFGQRSPITTPVSKRAKK